MVVDCQLYEGVAFVEVDLVQSELHIGIGAVRLAPTP